MRHHRVARLVTLVVALVQLVAPTLASVADARLEREIERSPRVAAHLESHSTPSCPRAHPQDCALCQLIHATASAPPLRGVVPPAIAEVAVAVDAAPGRAAASEHAPALPRAPPTV